MNTIVMQVDPVTGEPLGVWWKDGVLGTPEGHYAVEGHEEGAHSVVGPVEGESWPQTVERLLVGEDGLTFVRPDVAAAQEPAVVLEMARRAWAGTTGPTDTSRFTAAARRRRLAATAAGLTEHVVPDTVPFDTPVRVSDAHHFRVDPSGQRLVVLVAEGESDRQVDESLAAGLALQGDRDLHVVLPDVARRSPADQPVWQATADRLPWIDTPTWLWVHGDGHVRPVPTPRRTTVLQRACQQGGPVPWEGHDLGDRAGWVQPLVHWATQTSVPLKAAHRGSYLAWHVDGRKVLQVRRTTAGVAVTGGVNYTHADHGPRPAKLHLQGPVTDEEVAEVQAAVELAATRRMDGTDDADVEARLQSRLDDAPAVLGLVGPVLRELPLSRPGSPRAYVDLVGVDGAGNVHLVETKVKRDWMLGLQALDYWVWARANRQALVDVLTTAGAALADKPKVFLDVVVGTTNGDQPGDIRLLLPQLEALTGSMTWRIGDVTGWRTPDDTQVVWHRRGTSPLPGRRHVPPRFAFDLQQHLLDHAARTGLSKQPFVKPRDWLCDKAWPAFLDLKESGKTHWMVGHVRSSQAFALNLFAGLTAEQRVAVAGRVDPDIVEAGPPVFEFEDLDDQLGEATHASPHRTQVDVTLACRTDDGTRILLLIEVKLTEDGFGGCSAAASPDNDRRDLCATPAPFGGDAEQCFQLRNHDREQRRAYDHHLGDLTQAVPPRHSCPFLGNNQSMRNVALAGSLVARGTTDRAHVMLCGHDDHGAIWRRWDEAVVQTPMPDGVQVRSLPASGVMLEHDSDDARLLADRYRLGAPAS